MTVEACLLQYRDAILRKEVAQREKQGAGVAGVIAEPAHETAVLARSQAGIDHQRLRMPVFDQHRQRVHVPHVLRRQSLQTEQQHERLADHRVAVRDHDTPGGHERGQALGLP
jgi:hypothetical protein